MAFDELTLFLQAAADADELLRLHERIDARFELAAVSARLGATLDQGGPVLLFENVSGCGMPVVTNLLGHRRRFLRALGAGNFDEVVARLAAAFNPLNVSRNWTDALKSGTAAGDRARFAPRVVRRGLSQQVVKLGRDLTLDVLPVPHCWEQESNRTLTGGQVVMQGLNGRNHLGGYVAEVVDGETLLLHWTPQDEGRRIFQEYRDVNRQVPVAISLGGDPLLGYVAGLPLPAGIDPWLFAGILRNENVNLVRARSVEIDVPAEAEIIIEGYLDPVPPQGTGRAANRIGFVTENGPLPLFRVTAITHRANPILPAVIRSLSCREERVGAELTGRILLVLLRTLARSVRDLHLPGCGAERQALFLSLDDDSHDAVQQVRHALGAVPVASLAKLIVLVGAEVNVRDSEAVWEEVCRYADPGRDMRLSEGVADPCDPAQEPASPGMKLIIDATRKSSPRSYTSLRAIPAVPSAETTERADRYLRGLGQ